MSIVKKYTFPKILQIVILIILVILNVGRFVGDFNNTHWFSQIDFRNRVVGTRLARAGFDSYFFHWDKNYSDYYLDPHDSTTELINRVVWPPSTLLLHIPFVGIDYYWQKLFWFFTQWGLLFFSIYLVAEFSRDKITAWIIGLAVSWSYFWLYHVERGQFYIFYVFLFSLAYWFFRQAHRNEKKNQWYYLACGLILGLATALRPPLAIFLFLSYFPSAVIY